MLDGLIETDWWFGPLVSPIQIRKTDEPIRFQSRLPLFRVQPVPQHAYDAEALKSAESAIGFEHLSPTDWEGLDFALNAHEKANDERPGLYKREVARRSRTQHE